MEAGAVTWRLVPTDLVAELQRVVLSEQPAAQRKNLELLLEVEEGLGHVIADADGVIRNTFGVSTQHLLQAMRLCHRLALEAEGPKLLRDRPIDGAITNPEG